ncbi:MAG: hypothetical protein HYU36_16810 [Planctomycetes bacterium]|nr:hypothetical protein [Planctomycetota bacterium]
MFQALFFCVGFFSLLSQVVLFREMAVVFLGHEATVGLALAAWLLWGGLGSARHGVTAPSRDSLTFFVGWLALAPAVTVILIRLAKVLVPFGHLPGLFYTIVASLVLLFLPCWPIGSVFRMGCMLMEKEKPGGDVSRLYFWESLGAVAGGVVTTAFLLGRSPGFSLLCWGAVVLVVLGAWMLKPGRRLLPFLFLASALGLLIGSGRIDSWTRRVQFQGYTLEAHGESRYEHLAVGAMARTKAFFQNGVISAQFPDAAAQEELVHWPLLAHERPEEVLALGASALTAVSEILKHPGVRKLDLVEPDADASSMVRSALPPDQRAALSSPRVAWYTSDHRAWVRLHSGRYDVMLHTLPEPLNASVNRLFTRDFFKSARQALRPGGILALSISSSANYLSPEVAYLNASVLLALREVFESTAILAGQRMILLASSAPLNLSPSLLARRYEDRGIRNEVVVPSNFPFFLSEARREALELRLKALKGVEVNTDLHPVSSFYTWKVWLSMFVSSSHLAGLCFVVLVLFFGVSRGWKFWSSHESSAESLLIFAAGFASLCVEIVLLLAFQSVSGTLYWQLGLLFGAFMAGLTVGCGLFTAWKRPARGRPGTPLACLILAFAAYCMALWVFFQRAQDVFLGRELQLFALLIGLDGLLVGAAFPLALNTGRVRPERLYGADLWGASFGAFLAGAFLTPLLGARQTLAFCGVGLVLALAAALPRLRTSPR